MITQAEGLLAEWSYGCNSGVTDVFKLRMFTSNGSKKLLHFHWGLKKIKRYEILHRLSGEDE